MIDIDKPQGIIEDEEMKQGIRYLFIGFGAIAALSLAFFLGHSLGIHTYVEQMNEMRAEMDSAGAEKAREADLTFVRLDLQEYPHLSADTRNRIVTSLDSSSRKYRIPVGFLHAIFRIESNYQFQIDHPKVTIKIKGKQVTTCARGLGGVVWDIWADSLRANGICETASDLYVPEKNIVASAYILRYETDRVLKEKSKSTPYTVIREIIRNYYGAYSKPYEARMMQVTNELWLKRIAKDLLTS